MGSERTIHENVHIFKGVARIKYNAVTLPEAERMSSNEDDLAYIAGNTRIHGASDAQEFEWLIQTLYTGRDMDRLKVSNEQLYQRLTKII